MVQGLLHFCATRLVRLFYSRIEVRGQEHLLQSGPAVFVLNHPNGILDPVVLMAVIRRPVTFWSKSTLFAIPVVGRIASTFGAVPIFRKADIGRRGGAADAEDMGQSNEATFARCRAVLRSGGAMALFPEGLTHSEPRLLPMRTGAARMALQAAQESGWDRPISIVPVGLWYENNTRFRTAVLVAVGEPFAVTDYAHQYETDARSAVHAMTNRIEEGLRRVVLEAENSQLVKAIPVVAAWTAPDDEEPDLAAQHEWASRLLDAYRALQKRDPALLEHIAGEAWSFADMLRSVGVANPWQLETPRLRWWPQAFRVLVLTAFAIPALAGFLLSVIPYRLSGTLARSAWPDNRTQAGMIKLLGGTALMIAEWTVLAIAAGAFAAPLWGIGLAALAPPCAFVAMRWAEEARSVRMAVRYIWLRGRKTSLVAHLVERRHALASSIRKAVASLE